MKPCQEERLFPKDEPNWVQIHHIDEDGSLWVVLTSELSVLEDISTTLDAMVPANILEKPVVHEILSALHTDNTWYRACILSTEPSIKVRFIDYGDTLDVPLEKLAPLPDSLTDIQPLVIKVKLPPMTTAEPSSGSILLLKYIDCVEGIVTVDVITPDSEKKTTLSKVFPEAQNYPNQQGAGGSEASLCETELINFEECDPPVSHGDQPENDKCAISHNAADASTEEPCIPLDTFEDKLTNAEEGTLAQICVDQSTNETLVISQNGDDSCKTEVQCIPSFNEELNNDVECNPPMSHEDQPENNTCAISHNAADASTEEPCIPLDTFEDKLTNAEEGTLAQICVDQSTNETLVISQNGDDSCKTEVQCIPSSTFDEELNNDVECSPPMSHEDQPENNTCAISLNAADASTEEPCIPLDTLEDKLINAEEGTLVQICVDQSKIETLVTSQKNDDDNSCETEVQCTPSSTFNEELINAADASTEEPCIPSDMYKIEVTNPEECTPVLNFADQSNNATLVLSQNDHVSCKTETLSFNGKPIIFEEFIPAMSCVDQTEESPLGMYQKELTGIKECTPTPFLDDQSVTEHAVLCKIANLSPTCNEEMQTVDNAALSWTNVLFQVEEPSLPPLICDNKLISADEGSPTVSSTGKLEANEVLCNVAETTKLSQTCGDFTSSDKKISCDESLKKISETEVTAPSKINLRKSENLEMADFLLTSSTDCSNINDSIALQCHDGQNVQQKPRIITKGCVVETPSPYEFTKYSDSISTSSMNVPTKVGSSSFQEFKSILEFELSIVREQNRLQLLALQKKMEQNLAKQINAVREEMLGQLQGLYNEVSGRLQFINDTVVHKMADMYSDITMLKNEKATGNAPSSYGRNPLKNYQHQDVQNTSLGKDLLWDSPHQEQFLEHTPQSRNNYQLSPQKHNAPSYSSHLGSGDASQPMAYNKEKIMRTAKTDNFSEAANYHSNSNLSQNVNQFNSTYLKMDHFETGQEMKVEQGMGNKPQSKVVAVNNLNTQKINPDHLFNLFGVYGEVLLVKIIADKGKAYVEMGDLNQAGEVICHLNNTSLMGKKLRLTTCKFEKLSVSREDAQSNTCKDFKKPNYHKLQRNRFIKWSPSRNLVIRNVLNTVSDEKIKEIFSKGGFPVKSLKVAKMNDEKNMVYAKFGSTEEAVNALTVMHLQETSDWVRMFITFAKEN